MGYKYPRVQGVNQVKPKLCEGCINYGERCVTTGLWQPNARITFVGESPSWTSIGAQTPLVGKNGLLLHKLLRATVQEHYDADFEICYNTTYAAGAEGKPLKEVVDHCGNLWRTQWANHYGQQDGTHVLVPLGMIAAKSCGLTARKISDIRGRANDSVIGQRKVKVLPCLSLAHLSMKPGLTRIFQRDLKAAIDLAYFNKMNTAKSIEELSKDYIIPQTIEEVKEICDHIIGYYDPAKQDNPWKWPIAVDTETNSLKPYDPTAKVLIISFAWDDGKATAIMLDHPETPYNPEDAWAEVRRVLECPKPKTFHNAKFDLKFLEHTYGIAVNNFAWDTMLAEHWLDEDKKGQYSLKKLGPVYAPAYDGYEEDLHKALRNAREDQVTDEYTVEGLDFFGESEAEDVEIDPNEDWKYDPEWPESITAEQKEEYRTHRDAWFKYDKAGEGKKRGVVIRRWKSFCKKLNLPIPEVTPTKKKAAKQKADVGFANVNLQTLLPYAAVDADLTRLVHKKQLRRMHVLGHPEDGHAVMRDLYLPGTRALGHMEFVGAKVDLAKADEYDKELGDLVAHTEKRIHELALQEFNIQSAAELGAVMRGCGFPILKTTEKDKRMSLTKDVLLTYQTNYAAIVTDDMPSTDDNRRLTDAGRLEFVEALLLYRAAYNMKVRFIKKLRELSKVDGRIHTGFHLNGTSTGRLSSSNLNLQNIPHYMCRITRPVKGGPPKVVFKGFNVKDLIVPDDEDEVFWNLDIKAAEIRVLCYESGDPNLITAVNEGADIHTVFLTKIKHPEFNPDLKDPGFKEKYDHYIKLKKAGDPEIEHFRTAVKRTVFGTLYGAGPKKVAEQLGDESPEGIAFAESIRRAIFEAFPTILEYIKRTEKEIDAKGYVASVFGRHRRFWLAAVSNFLNSKAKREAVNFKIQSPSSDLVLRALIRVMEHAHEIGLKLELTVHDSIAGTTKRKNVPKMKAFFDKYVKEKTAEESPWLPVSWEYDLEIGPTYGTKESYSRYMKNHADIAA